MMARLYILNQASLGCETKNKICSDIGGTSVCCTAIFPEIMSTQHLQYMVKKIKKGVGKIGYNNDNYYTCYRGVFNAYVALPWNVHLQSNDSFMKMLRQRHWDAVQGHMWAFYLAMLHTLYALESEREKQTAVSVISTFLSSKHLHRWRNDSAAFARVLLDSVVQDNNAKEVLYWCKRMVKVKTLPQNVVKDVLLYTPNNMV